MQQVDWETVETRGKWALDAMQWRLTEPILHAHDLNWYRGRYCKTNSIRVGVHARMASLGGR